MMHAFLFLLTFFGICGCAQAADSDPATQGVTTALHDENIEGEDSHPHAANAVLFLFAALSFGLVFRRAMAGFIIPYTGILVVRLRLLCVYIISLVHTYFHNALGIQQNIVGVNG
jgi:hypothetical protein